jgi:hypothetical protein
MTMTLKAALRFAALALLIPAAARAQDGRIQLEILDRLAARASQKQEVTIGPETLATVGQSLVPQGPNSDAARQALTKLKGIFVRHYEFDDAKAYSMDDIATIRKQLATPGWVKIVSNEEKRKDGGFELQEIYTFQQGGTLNGLVILSAEPRELSIVNIVGPIAISELGALGGVLGIPPTGDLIPH